MEKARDFTHKIFNLLLKPEMRILPGQLAFFLVLTVIPLVALIATLAAALSLSTEGISQAITQTVPEEISGIINGIAEGNGLNFNMIIFYISTFLLASNGTYSMINTSNEIYKVKPSNILNRRAKAIFMIFILVCLFLFLLLVPVFGNVIFDITKKITGEAVTVRVIQEMLVILKYPLIIIVIFINIKLMYIIAPDRDIPSNTTNEGALFTTVCWILSTEIFAFYIERFSKYDLFYGSISNILVLLLWVYLLSYIFVFGMVINAGIYKEELENMDKEE